MPRYVVERTFPGGLELPPNQQAIRQAAGRNGLPVDQITEVRVPRPLLLSVDEPRIPVLCRAVEQPTQT